MWDIKPIRKPWTGYMTARERFLNQMRCKGFDRSVNMEFGFWAENYSQWPIFVEHGVKGDRMAHNFFAFDPDESITINSWFSHSMPTEVVEDRGDKFILRNNEGVLEELSKTGLTTIPRYIGSSVVTPSDWERVKDEYFRRDHPCRFFDKAATDILAQEDRDYPLGIQLGSLIGKIRDLLTFEGLAYAVYDYPDMVEDMVETCCLLIEDGLDRLLPYYIFDYAAGWEDICYKNGPIVSVDFFKNVVAPRYGRIKRKLNQYGIDIWMVDCDGDVRPLLPYFLENGVNCLFPYEVNCCCHPEEILTEYGGELRIMGGFDKMQLIAGKEQIKTYMKSIEPLVAKGGFIPFCDHSCPPDVTQENYLYYLDLKEATFGMK